MSALVVPESGVCESAQSSQMLGSDEESMIGLFKALGFCAAIYMALAVVGVFLYIIWP